MACWLEVHGEAPVSGHRTRTPSVKNYKGPRYRTTPRQLRLCLHLASPSASLLCAADAFRVTWLERIFVTKMHWPRDAVQGLASVYIWEFVPRVLREFVLRDQVSPLLVVHCLLFLHIRIVWSCFYLLFWEILNLIWRLPFPVYVKLKLSITDTG